MTNTDNTEKAGAQPEKHTTEHLVAFVMKEIEDRGYDLSDLGGKTCEEITQGLTAKFPSFAAPPELLAACKAALAALTPWQTYEQQEANIKLQAAISKAEGSAQ